LAFKRRTTLGIKCFGGEAGAVCLLEVDCGEMKTLITLFAGITLIACASEMDR